MQRPSEERLAKAAYNKGVPNREVMARLYVSEGTFHRIRRHAVRAVTRYLMEIEKSSPHN